MPAAARPSQPAGQPDRRPGSAPHPALLVAAGAVVLEVLALAGVVVLYAVELVGGAARDAVGASATAALAAALAVGLALCVRFLLAGRRWARAPLVTWQLFQIVLTAPLARGPLWWVAAVFVALSLVAAVCLVSRPVAEHVEDDGAPPPAL